MAHETTGPAFGSIPLAVGSSSNVRIPVLGQSNLVVQIRPRNFFEGAESVLLVQTHREEPFLRLDYAYNTATGKVDYQWSHAGLGVGAPPRVTARMFRILGRPLLLVAAVLDGISIVRSTHPLLLAQRAAGHAYGWIEGTLFIRGNFEGDRCLARDAMRMLQA